MKLLLANLSPDAQARMAVGHRYGFEVGEHPDLVTAGLLEPAADPQARWHARTTLGQRVSKLAYRAAEARLSELGHAARAAADGASFFNSLSDYDRAILHGLASCDSLVFYQNHTGRSPFRTLT